MRVYRIREWTRGSYLAERRYMLFGLIPLWENISGPNSIEKLEDLIKERIAADAFRPRTVSVWSEKKVNGK